MLWLFIWPGVADSSELSVQFHLQNGPQSIEPKTLALAPNEWLNIYCGLELNYLQNVNHFLKVGEKKTPL